MPLPTRPADSSSEVLYDWRLDEIVVSLRQLRDASLAARKRLGCPAKLPSRRTLTSIVDQVCAALFPNRLSARELKDESVDFYVGHTLDQALRELVEQVVQEYRFVHSDGNGLEEARQKAIELVRNFAADLPSIRAVLDTDIRAAYESDPAARSVDEVLACYPGVRAVMHHRIAHALHRRGACLIARMISEIAHSLTGVEIHPGATIGESFFIDHGTGVVIGETSIIGDRVHLYHGVTLGARSRSLQERHDADHVTSRHPIVEDDVTIYSGATLLGPIRVGRGSVIGGNVWLTTSVQAGSNISQAALRSEAFDEGLGI
ncbi:Serine acetyltransferase [Caulifigura coniformis]|uniref:Serine acetyltransferase n=1 Tax=Caulifigura coniformis TaxID=2527983 RepID=A0A517SK78_9PLAN|nr:serine O-acetyltransferase EpsC [Caulifigura coniformis]QDT56527.1 Serine acetyltransferase [Caulifigura coniformis]